MKSGCGLSVMGVRPQAEDARIREQSNTKVHSLIYKRNKLTIQVLIYLNVLSYCPRQVGLNLFRMAGV